MFNQLDDTIVAISSPLGANLRSIIRLSGSDALVLADHVFMPGDGQPLSEAPAYGCLLGRVRIETAGSVPAEAYTFRAPASYTRQDVVELHLIGSPPILAMVLDQLTSQGARLAEPGEFTARAYFSGAMDLTRVEGVAAIINACNDSQLRASEALLHGKLSQLSTKLRDQLADLLALIEAQIDFSTEPIDFVSPEQIICTIDKVTADLESLLLNAPAVEHLEILPQVILAGWPNAGKSTLFNRLTGMDRAIQSATAGTTRDVLSAPLTLPGGEVMLMDSAGLTDPPVREQDTHPAVLAERVTRRTITSADAILLVVDITNDPKRALSSLIPIPPNRPIRIIANKIDLVPSNTLQSRIADIGGGHQIIAVSALSGDGLEALRDEIGKMLFSGLQAHGSDTLALSHRQIDTLRDAHEALFRVRRICDASTETTEYMELLALDIREAMNALSLLTGEVVTEELLGRIFSRFCIGK